MKKSIIAVSAVLALLLGTGIFFWVSYYGTPYRTLNEIRASVQNKDWLGFEERVDVDAVVSSVISDAAGEDNEVAEGMATLFGGLASSAIKEYLRKSIETSENSTPAIFVDMFNPSLTKKDLTLSKSGKLAYVDLPLRSEYVDTSFSFKIVFREIGLGNYKLIGLSGKDAADEKLEEMKQAYYVHRNKSTVAKIRETVHAEYLGGELNYTRSHDLYYFTTRWKINNKSKDTLESISLGLLNGDEEFSTYIPKIKPGIQTLETSDDYDFQNLNFEEAEPEDIQAFVYGIEYEDKSKDLDIIEEEDLKPPTSPIPYASLIKE